ncbi:MAG: argininosuccinate lyase [Elusimicrobia bacterium]|nr:argininosuccinate lyase [Elusimicrobiota bacterium]
MKSSHPYISSFSFDQRLAPYDIQGSIAHVRMLARRKIIPSSHAKTILSGLNSIQRDLAKGKRLRAAEDIHFAIENELVQRVGPVGKKMHTARSRNDQVALDLKLYVRDKTKQILDSIHSLQKTILNCATKNKSVLMPGFTHLQHGQPIYFAHHILAYAWMLQRDQDRYQGLIRHLNESPLGACALGGTSFPIDRNFAAKLLGFSRPTENSIDTVSDRDFILEFVFDSSMTMVHLSRLAEELVIWSSSEFDFVQIAEEFTSGSSIMPQKRNPDSAELLRGKSSRAIGALMQLLSLLKSQPLSYNRDLQEDKPPLFDTADTVLDSVSLADHLIRTLKLNRTKMENSCKQGFLLATELADYLANKGVPFREAHSIVSQFVEKIRSNSPKNQNLEKIPLSDLKAISPHFDRDVYQFLSLHQAAKRKNSYGGTGDRALSTQIKNLTSLLQKN